MSTLFALLVCAAGVHAPHTAAKPATGAFKPFDLTYVPRTSTSLVAVRPSELLQHIGKEDKAIAVLVRRTLAAAFAFLDGDLKAAAPPALTDIEQIIVSAKLAMGIETNPDGRGTTSVTDISSGVVRTAKPFDWAGCVKKWFPKAEVIRHAGREYLRVPIELGKETTYLALFVADTRTLAFDTDEDEIKGLLTRLDKKTPVEVPAGWDDVSREMLAVWQDATVEKWLTAPARPKRSTDRAFVTAARSMAALAVGFSSGERTVVRMVATARDATAASKVQTALKTFAEQMAEEADIEPAAAKLFADTGVSRDGKTVRVTASKPGDLLRRLLDPDAEQ